MTQLDERLTAIAQLALDAMRDAENPCAADIGCDHGMLAAHLLQVRPDLRVIASDVSAPSLEKARRLITSLGMAERAKFCVADGLDGIDEPVHVIVIAGMGAGTILKIIREGMDKAGCAALIVQANLDIPMLRERLTQMGFAIEKERFAEAAGRQYATLLVRKSDAALRPLTQREALLGSAINGMTDKAQRRYYAWLRGVRIREMERLAALPSANARRKLEESGVEAGMITEAMSMRNCTAADIERMVGEIAPFELAEEWDNVGMLFGRRGSEVTRALVALDVTPAVIEEAKALGAQLIVTHHPIMFSARKRVTDADYEGAMMLDMAAANLSLIAAHTNLDAAPGGVNDTLMAAMGAQNVRGEGCIRVGDVAEGTTMGMLRDRAKKALKADVRIYGAEDMPVHVLGCCSGSGSSEIAAAKALGADGFITGEVRHNLALEAMGMGVGVIEAGHYETENPVCEVLASALQTAADALEYKVMFFCSKVNPFGRSV